MLHCNMNASICLGLDDLLADLQHARRSGELGRLAVIAYCDVRGWARQAGEFGVAEQSTSIFTTAPHASKEAFLEQVDGLIFELQRVRPRFQSAQSLPDARDAFLQSDAAETSH